MARAIATIQPFMITFRLGTHQSLRRCYPCAAAAVAAARPFSSDEHFKDALRKLQQANPETPPRFAKTKLKESWEPGAEELLPVAALGSGGMLEGQKVSLRQLRVRSLVMAVMSEEIGRSAVGHVVEITEVSLSKDLRSVTLWWQYDPALMTPNASTPPRVPAGHGGTWLRPPPLTKTEKSLEKWFEARASKFRQIITHKVQFKVRRTASSRPALFSSSASYFSSSAPKQLPIKLWEWGE